MTGTNIITAAMQSTIRVLHISGGLGPGGKERQMTELIRNFNGSRFIMGVLTFGKNQHYSSTAKEYSSYFRELTKRPTRLEPFFTIWKCYSEFRPDIVHTWDSLSSMYAWLPCKYHKIKLIDGSIRDSGVDKGWHYHFKRFFLKQASMIISNSMAGLKAYNVEGQVVYNAIDTSRFRPAEENKEFNMVMTANFSEFKDQKTFLNAAVNLVSNNIVDNVYLLGDGLYRNKYLNWIEHEYPEIAPRFHFEGAVSNVEEYLSRCHVGVLCSTPEYSEGLSNSVLEYMAAGLVPIVTDIGGSAEIVDDSRNGYLIQPEDHHRIIELVTMLKSKPGLRGQIIGSAKSTIDEKFSKQKNIDMITMLYGKISTAAQLT